MLASTYPTLKNLLFKLDAEKAHHLSLASLRTAEKAGLLAKMAPRLPASQEVTCMGLTFAHPVGLAAGLDKEGNTIDALGRLGFSFIEIGTITPKAQAGNPKPRLFRLPEHEALINRMGFNNPGIEAGVANVKSRRSFTGPVGFNVGKNKVTPNEEALSDYLIAFRAAYEVADYITVNLSSPNTPGLRDLQAAEPTARLLAALQEERETLAREHGKRVPIAFKVAPDLTDEHITELAGVFREGGLDALIATNTTIDRSAIAGHRHAEEAGGLSGAPESDLSTRVIGQFHSALGKEVPIIGVGGIMTAEDALAKLAAGATLLQLYTGFIYRGPQLIADILAGLSGQTS
ncbi:quinone-dependent dihydroorotate dehydrogenase [Roseibacillus ishigakijimensis]|uniref:Dihydroorotate dehydrogenase (quinone) n=1 Tax=Roseibacillus ishigakijimensis TaxID=454146 RepID=A0A934RW74_9BACT|nr:quinone-dependent dihydroorotate dehydrogenase [Roseibacillus ishigakijimensis]MBK1835566.1 quinone-dependent dihydroorotate dehydrogenase [Roseibacillus ishigakijimensis]